MCKAPFLDETHGGTRADGACQKLPVESKGRLLTLVLGVKVRNTMLTVKHADDDAEEG